MRFSDRADAGRRLARRLEHLQGHDVVVLGLPRGGVPVAKEVAGALHAPLDVILVRKLGVPFQPELAMGAIGEDGVKVMNADVLARARIDTNEVAAVEARERQELARRSDRYRTARPREPLAGRTALVVDDGIATGSTIRAACRVARAHGAARVVVGVPVGPPGSSRLLEGDADEVVVAEEPRHLSAIGQWYDDFTQTTDEEVVRLLRSGTPVTGDLTVPDGATGLVVFAHGSGSSRHSPRNRAVAAVLHEAGLATFLGDLLSEDEAADRRRVFDIPLLARRVRAAVAHLDAVHGRWPLGLFGASTGAAAALWAAAELGDRVGAVVSRGGRPDLAAERLADVHAPTLLVVGGNDAEVLRLNHTAAARLGGEHRIEVVAGAGHLFEEPGALEQVAALARDWFTRHLQASA